MKIQVYRTGASSYQNSSFLKNEQKQLESIPGVKYINSLKETVKDLPFILLTNTHTNTEEVPDIILNKTALMIHPNSGHDNISDDFIKEANFPIVVGNSIRCNAVSEYVLSCIFKEITPIQNHTHWSSDRTWDRKLLRDQKVLILGHGHIGRTLNQVLSPLVKDIKVFDPIIKKNLPNNIIQDFNYNIFEKVDILIIAANLNNSSRQMVNRIALNLLSTNNIIINPARGEIIKEDELIQYLQQNPKSKCYLDVFNEEPFPPGYQNQLDNLNKTSHIAGVFKKLNQDIITFEHQVIEDFVTNHLMSSNQDSFKQVYSDSIIKMDEAQLRVL